MHLRVILINNCAILR